ncbi:MAG TPA: DUF72 domain-containing protein [Bryobacteraceae bacterium]|nr:DUF72 domain-containing protein [Bryobacteraceae bacterium]
MSAGSLFDTRPPFDRDRLARKLARLREQGVYIGTSSWKYEGWCGQIYTRERYLSRGAFSQKVFEAECLREYGEVFPTVCGDFSFYQFPVEEYWRRLFANAAPGLQFALKVPEQITAKVFPRHARYGPQAGLVNTSFLDPALFAEAFLNPLDRHRERISTLIFEFGTFPHFAYADVRDFVRDLDRFLAVIPRQYRYSVEIRNPEFLHPDYFHCLTAHGAAHVFNAWSRMPELREQISIPEAFTADFTICRALLRRGRPYENAVQAFSPYEEIRDPNPEGRAALRDLIDSARSQGIAAFIYVNNRFEGNAPRTIDAVVDGL